MRKTEHIFLRFTRESLQNTPLSTVFPKSLKIPERVFPPRFMVEDESFFVGGYFVCYDKKVMDMDVVLRACRERNWHFLANIVADFLLIYFDYSTKELFILSDQFGKFPCYFFVDKDRLILSTDFSIVKDSLESCSLNISSALDYLSRSIWMSDSTVVSGIKRIPPGTLLKIDRDFSFSFTPMIDLDNFLASSEPPYSSIEQFADDFLLLFEKLVKERLEKLGNLQFSADISSGFDVNLICYVLSKVSKEPFTCYSGVSRYTFEDTDPKIVESFAKKHNLTVKFIQLDNVYPFASNKDLEWIERQPTQALKYEAYTLLQQAAHHGSQAKFTGDGGDEAYGAYLIDKLAQFPIQQEYFHAVGALKLGIDEILAPRAMEMLLDKKRFQEKKFYPLIVSPSAVSSNLENFLICWETGVWLMTPFMDPRLIRLARRIPLKGRKAPVKQDIWKHRSDIFLQDQFRKKGGPAKRMGLFLEKNPDFVVSLLYDSLLAEKGWIQADKIIQDIQNRSFSKHLDVDILAFLINLIELEYFIQHNNVKVPG